ncbi:MAG: hypothetical protein V1800_13245 [Candidatus Latescibacterota bacterium]
MQESVRAILSNAIRYWERARRIYNTILFLIVVAVFLWAWPSSSAALSWVMLQNLFMLAVMANALYCFAYAVDLFVQLSAFRPGWLQYRWMLFVIGTLFSAMLTRLMSMGLFSAKGC